MTGISESNALAVIRCGGSYEDAMKASGLSLDEVMKLWTEFGKK